MKKWKELSFEDKRRIVLEINETYDLSNYEDEKSAAHNVRIGYEEDPEWFNFIVDDIDEFEKEIRQIIKVEYYKSYDVYFHDETADNNKGWSETYDYCKNYIEQYNGTDESYFADYKGGIVDIVCNETYEVVYSEKIPKKKTISTLQDLADYINSADEWPLDVEDIIEENDWESDTHLQFGVCHSDNEKIVLNDDGKAIVININ